MPNVTFACPDCQTPLRLDLGDQPPSVVCPTCGRPHKTMTPEYVSGRVKRCVVCAGEELFVRKDFPQRLGVAIVVLGFVASCITWAYHNVIATFAILFGTAFVDVALFLVMGNLLECYRCHAQYRGLTGLAEYGAFDLEVHERHRQQRLRLRQSGRAN